MNIVKMKFILFLLIMANNTFAQEILINDLDGDRIKDTIRFEKVADDGRETYSYSRIVCLLSSKQFRKAQTQPILTFAMAAALIESGIASTRNGFEFFRSYAKGGMHITKAQFRYDKKTKEIQLIGMSRNSTGSRHGDGRSSVNLLTGKYIGDWHYYEYNLGKLVKIPTIKTKMDFGKIYIKDFNDDIMSDYGEKCGELHYDQGMKIIRRNVEEMEKKN